MIKHSTKIEKGWGYELHIHNDNGYCGKILHFKKGARFSMHYHINKHETWYVSYGVLLLKIIDTLTADIEEIILREGDIVTIHQGLPHQLIAKIESEIFEVSTFDSPHDSYRIQKGDNQK